MPEDQQRSHYRSLIDALVEECRDGQGQVLPEWVRRGVWNRNALDDPDALPEEHRMNTVLAHLGDEDRAVVARMLELSYEGAIHDTLRILNDHEVPRSMMPTKALRSTTSWADSRRIGSGRTDRPRPLMPESDGSTRRGPDLGGLLLGLLPTLAGGTPDRVTAELAFASQL